MRIVAKKSLFATIGFIFRSFYISIGATAL